MHNSVLLITPVWWDVSFSKYLQADQVYPC